MNARFVPFDPPIGTSTRRSGHLGRFGGRFILSVLRIFVACPHLSRSILVCRERSIPKCGKFRRSHSSTLTIWSIFRAGRRESSRGRCRASRALVEEARDDFLRWWAARASAPAITELSSKAEQIRAVELERALRKLSHLSERDRNVVAAFSVGIVNKLLHEPITNLRGSLDGGETSARCAGSSVSK